MTVPVPPPPPTVVAAFAIPAQPIDQTSAPVGEPTMLRVLFLDDGSFVLQHPQPDPPSRLTIVRA